MTLDTLAAYGLERMDDDEIASFLSNQAVGVLGLATDGAPYLLPLSYAFDGEDRLYFTYVVGESSRKRALSEQGTAAFLVYSAETMFSWRSVSLEGELSAVPDHRWGELEELLAGVWRPELFQSAGTGGSVEIYRFEVTDVSGIKHTGLAPEFEE